jgi:hypothetical protein
MGKPSKWESEAIHIPTSKDADAELVNVVYLVRGQVVRVGTKPWAVFSGDDAAQRGEIVAAAYERLYGMPPSYAGGPWREDQKKDFDYTVRLDR